MNSSPTGIRLAESLFFWLANRAKSVSLDLHRYLLLAGSRINRSFFQS